MQTSFSKVPGAGQSAPVQPIAAETPVQNAASAPAETPRNLPANVPPAPVGFYTGAEDDGQEVDSRDVKLPRLNLVQDMSGAALKEVAKVGEFVFKQTLHLPSPLRLVVCGFKPKKFVEKTKFGTEPRYANSLQEVYQLGGTDEWRSSKENDRKGAGPASNKPWFTPMVTSLVLIEKPESLSDEHFPYVSEDGKAYAAALWTVKSTSYGAFFVPLQSEKVTGVLRQGYFTHYVEMTSKKGDKHPAFEPVIKIREATSEAVRKLALKAAG